MEASCRGCGQGQGDPLGAVAAAWVRGVGGLYQKGGKERGEKSVDPGCVLKVDPMAFASGSKVGYEGERRQE